MNTDVLVISAHPDDAELACSGTVKKLTNEGRSVAFVDCTVGEFGSRGSAELRKTEAEASRVILGVSERLFLDMPDGEIMHTQENILKIVSTIRYFRPQLLIIPPSFERHPDHEAVHRICRAASFTSGLTKLSTTFNGAEQEPHRPIRTLCYQLHYDFPRVPDFYIDITETFESKMQSIGAFSTQFHSKTRGIEESRTRNRERGIENEESRTRSRERGNEEVETFISHSSFIEGIEARARYHGNRISTRYAEAFLSIEPVAFPSLSVFL